MITSKDVVSIGFLKRTHNRNLPEFVFVLRDGLFVPFRSEDIASLMGEEIYVLRSDIYEEDDGEMSWQELVGYEVMDVAENGEWVDVGEIKAIDESTINILVTLEDGRLVPLHEDFIIEIDEEKHILRVHFPFRL